MGKWLTIDSIQRKKQRTDKKMKQIRKNEKVEFNYSTDKMIDLLVSNKLFRFLGAQ